ncbi:MAG: hypothetical protein ACREE1_03630 [Stellaceae bacterium]
MWFTHEAGQGGGAWDLIRIFESKVDGEAVAWLKTIGIEIDPKPGNGRIAATYDYRDEAGKLLFQVVRFDPKNFKQRRPDGVGGWVWSTKDVRKVPYRLPELLAAPAEAPVYIAEGEKDVERLRALGLVATCNPGGGAKRKDDGKPVGAKWPASFGIFFKGRHVIVLPDNDEAGHDHAQAIARNLAPVAASVRILELGEDYPSLPPKGDVSDWLAAGGNRDVWNGSPRPQHHWRRLQRPAARPRLPARPQPDGWSALNSTNAAIRGRTSTKRKLATSSRMRARRLS